MTARRDVRWVTAAACNYLPQVRVLARSFTAQHAGRRLFVLLTDVPPTDMDLAAEPFDVLLPRDVGIPDPWLMTHTCKQLSAAAKPHAILHLLDASGSAVVFIDPDSVVLAPMHDVEEQVAGHSLTLRPHMLTGGPRGEPLRAFVEDRVLEAGVFNGGLIGASDTPEARAFLTWWARVNADGCHHDLAQAQHFDQRWLDLAPSFVENLGRFTDPGLDVAFWSLPGATLDEVAGALAVDGYPCRFLHFTGFVPERPDVLVAYFDNLLQVDDVPAIAPHYRDYVTALREEGREHWRDATYGFGVFDDGSVVPDIARQMYAALGPERQAFGDPFRTGQGSFHAWIHEPVDQATPVISREWLATHRACVHLQQAFPDPLEGDRERFHAWTESDDAGASRVARYIIHA